MTKFKILNGKRNMLSDACIIDLNLCCDFTIDVICGDPPPNVPCPGSGPGAPCDNNK